MTTRDEAEKKTPAFVALGATHYGTTSWPVRLFNPIVAVKGNKPVFLWETDATGEPISEYEELQMAKVTQFVYRKFELDDEGPRCLVDYTRGRSWADIRVHTEMGSLGVRKSWPETKPAVDKLLKNYGLTLPEPQPKDKKDLKAWEEKEKQRQQREVASDWYNVLRALPLEEMGMSTNLLLANVPDVPGHKMHRLDLAAFLAKHPFGEDEPLVADWDFGPADIATKCKTSKTKDGDAAKMAVKYGGPPARDAYHVDFKLNPLWALKHKKWKGSPDGNWYKDTLDAQLKGTSALWKKV